MFSPDKTRVPISSSDGNVAGLEIPEPSKKQIFIYVEMHQYLCAISCLNTRNRTPATPRVKFRVEVALYNRVFCPTPYNCLLVIGVTMMEATKGLADSTSAYRSGKT